MAVQTLWRLGPVLILGAALTTVGAGQPKRAPVTSHVTILSVDGKDKRVLYSTPRLFEAPNWSPDGKYLLLNSQGKLWRLSLAGGEPEPVHTGSVTGVNNDHGISPDGKQFAISAGHIFVLPASGGSPRQVTTKTPSYYHGWSPDGKTLVYCARRDGNFDIYSIPAAGGAEKRLTSHPGYDDGPDYSPDGKWIYFNSDRSGSWDIWRMPADGAGDNDARAERVTRDDYEDWFPHPSPDGKWLVFLSYQKGTKGHPTNQGVVLRLMPLPGAKVEAGGIRELVRLRGGQGTINVASWAPDGKRFAYVSYSSE
jgi:Tol biopolymer transport system component